MAQLKANKPVEVGVEVDYPGGAIGAPPGGYVNNNALTSHFVVINSCTITNGNVSFGYVDNATSVKSKATSSNNQFSLNKTTGGMEDNTNVITSSGPNANPKSTGYQVTEVRKTSKKP